MANEKGRKVKATEPASETRSADEPSPIDAWLGGFVVFAMVIGAIIGGVVCTFVIVSSPRFTDAMRVAPLFLAWITLVAAEGAVSWAGFFPAIATCWISGKAVSRRNRKWLIATLVSIVLVVALCFIFEPRAFPLDINWPLLEDHRLRIGIMSWIVLTPPLVAIVAMWFTAVHAIEMSQRPDLDVDDVDEYVTLRERLQSLLWHVGIVIGGGVLATGVLRQSMLDGDFAKEKAYPPALVLSYGAFFTLLLVISYVPPFLLMRHAGKRFVTKLLKNRDDVLKWHEDRKKLNELLNIDVGLQDLLKNSIAILAPIIAGLASTALPK